MRKKIGDKIKNNIGWLVVLVLLIFSNAILFCFWRYDFKLVESEFSEKFSLLNPNREFYNPRDLIVNIQPLRDQLNEIGKDPNVSIYFEFLNTGANIAVNKDLQVWPASLMKIPIAMATMKKVERGEWRMDRDFVMEENDKNSIFGELYKNQDGTHFSLEELLNVMLINSDNTARNIIARNLDMYDFKDVIDHIGVDFDYNKDDQISAKRYSVVWRSLFNATYLTPENSQKLIEIMSKSSAKNYLALNLPSSIKFSHKIGVLYDEMTFADSGIVYIPNRPYILTVMIQNHSQAEAEDIMKNISEKVYQYIFQY